MSPPTARARAARVLDVLLGVAAVLLAITLVLWRSGLPAGRWTQLRPEDVFTGGLVLAAVRCALAPWRWPVAAPSRALAIAVAAYAATFSWIAVGRHRTFQTHALDLGQYAQNLWHLAHGQPPYDTVTGWHVWGNHFSPIFYLLAPLTLVFSGPAWLLVGQAIALALGAVPLYLLARRALGPDLAAAVGVLYLINPSLHGINIRDFHPAALAIPLLLTAMYAWDAGRPVLFGLATVLTLTTREDAAIAVLGLGLWLVVSRRAWLDGVAVAAVAMAWLFTTVQWLMPRFREDAAYPYVTAHYRHLGDSLGAVVASPLLRPLAVLGALAQASRVTYLLAVLGPLGFLPLLAPLAAIGAVPGLAQNMLSDYPVLLNYRSQYQSFVLPFLCAGAVAALARLERDPRPAGLRWLAPRRALAVAAFASLLLTARTVNELAVTSWRPGPQHRAAERLIAQIPRGARVSTTERFFPHLYDRAVPFLFPAAAASSDYLLLDGAAVSDGRLGGARLRRDGARMIVAAPQWGGAERHFRVVAEASGLLLLQPVGQSSRL